MPDSNTHSPRKAAPNQPGGVTYWRAEGSLLDLSALRQAGFFTWNAQSFDERWKRRAGMGLMTLWRPVAYLGGRKFATRVLYTLLRGISRDRLDLLGEEYFEYQLKTHLREEAVEKLREASRNGEQVVLVGQTLEHILRPMARHLGIEAFAANRLEFRDGRATGRLLDPVIRPRGFLGWLGSGGADGRISQSKLLRHLGWREPEKLQEATQRTDRPAMPSARSVVVFDGVPRLNSLSVRDAFANRHVLLIGVTGFIGKVWLVDLLKQVPEIGKITLLIRRNRTTTGQRRFEKIVEESPAVDPLHEQYGRGLGAFLLAMVAVCVRPAAALGRLSS